MESGLVLNRSDEAIELLESVEEATSLVLPSGKRLWVWPEQRLEDLCDVLTDPEFRVSLERGIQEASEGQFIEIDPTRLT
jgi:hypothetical protein